MNIQAESSRRTNTEKSQFGESQSVHVLNSKDKEGQSPFADRYGMREQYVSGENSILFSRKQLTPEQVNQAREYFKEQMDSMGGKDQLEAHHVQEGHKKGRGSKIKHFLSNVKKKFSFKKHFHKARHGGKSERVAYDKDETKQLLKTNDELEQKAFKAMQDFFKYEDSYKSALFQKQKAEDTGEASPYSAQEIQELKDKFDLAKELMSGEQRALISSDIELNLAMDDVRSVKTKIYEERQKLFEDNAKELEESEIASGSASDYITGATSVVKFTLEAKNMYDVALDTHSTHALHNAYNKFMAENQGKPAEDRDSQLVAFAKLINNRNNFGEKVFLSNIQALQVLSAGADVVASGADAAGKVGALPAFAVSGVAKLTSSIITGVSGLGSVGYAVYKGVKGVAKANHEDEWVSVLKDSFKGLEEPKSDLYLSKKQELIVDLHTKGEVEPSVDLNEAKFNRQLNQMLQTSAVQNLTKLNEDYAAHSILDRLKSEKGNGPMFNLLSDLDVLNYEQLVILKKISPEDEGHAIELIKKSLNF